MENEEERRAKEGFGMKRKMKGVGVLSWGVCFADYNSVAFQLHTLGKRSGFSGLGPP